VKQAMAVGAALLALIGLSGCANPASLYYYGSPNPYPNPDPWGYRGVYGYPAPYGYPNPSEASGPYGYVGPPGYPSY
jgi:hypothetical protein